MKETAFNSFTLKNGNIFDSKAQAIVIPVHTLYDPYNPGIILGTGYERFNDLEKKFPKEDLKDFEVRMLNANQRNFIIVACFKPSHPFTKDYFKDAAKKTVRNALDFAIKNKISSIAFSVLMTGAHSMRTVKAADIVPVMKKVFDESHDKIKIELYAYSEDEYNEAVKSL